MDPQAETVLNQAIKLAPLDRVIIADALLESIAPETENKDLSMDTEVGQAWGEEVRRRIAEAENGTVEMIPAEQALPQPRQHG